MMITVDAAPGQKKLHPSINTALMSGVFTRDDGQRLKVYIDGAVKHDVDAKLTTNGASLVDDRRDADIIILETPLLLVIRPEWVDQLLLAEEMLPVELYAYYDDEAISVTTTPPPPPKSKARGHYKFNPQKDEFILERVRQEPRKRKLLQFYVELANTPELRGHTGNSIRSRFNNQLAKKLAWVYDRDHDGNYKLDDQGQRMKTTNIPDTHKTQFTHQDDYYLCQSIATELNHPTHDIEITDHAQFYRDEIEPRVNEGKTTMMLYAFFGRLAKEKPQHSQNLWRDHHRKYLLIDAVPYYLAYYEWCQRHGISPDRLPRKKAYDLSKINANRKRARAPEPLDQEIGQTADSDISRLHAVDVARVAAEAAEQAARAVAAQRLDVVDNNVAPEEELTGASPNSHHKRAKRMVEDDQISQIREDLLVPLDSPDEAEVTGIDMLSAYADDGDGDGNGDSDGHQYCYMNNALTLDEFVDVAFMSGDVKNKRDRYFKNLADELAVMDIRDVVVRLHQEGFTPKFIDHILLSCLMLSPVVGRYIELTGPKLFRLAKKPGDVKVPVLSYVSPRDDPEFWTLAKDHALVRYSFNGTDGPPHEAERRQFLVENRYRIDPEIIPDKG